MQAMHCIRQLVACSASGMHEHYVAASLADWRAGLCACLLDMRTQVVKECCITLAFIAQQMEMKAVHLFDFLLQSVQRLLHHKAKFIVSSGVVCIRFIICYTFSTRFLPNIFSGVADECLNIRRVTQEFLSQILHTWPLHILHRKVNLLKEAIRAGLLDNDAGVRRRARNSFWAFSIHFFVESDQLLHEVVYKMNAIGHITSAQKYPKQKTKTTYKEELDRFSATRVLLDQQLSSSYNKSLHWLSKDSGKMSEKETEADSCISSYSRVLLSPESDDSGIALENTKMKEDSDMISRSCFSDNLQTSGYMSDDENISICSSMNIKDQILSEFKGEEVLEESLLFKLERLLAKVEHGDFGERLKATQEISTLFERRDQRFLEADLPEIVQLLKKAFDSSEAPVRKCAVTSLAYLSIFLGEQSMKSYLGNLGDHKRRLLQLYTTRQKEALTKSVRKLFD